jgi:hypothetical protein
LTHWKTTIKTIRIKGSLKRNILPRTGVITTIIIGTGIFPTIIEIIIRIHIGTMGMLRIIAIMMIVEVGAIVEKEGVEKEGKKRKETGKAEVENAGVGNAEVENEEAVTGNIKIVNGWRHRLTIT